MNERMVARPSATMAVATWNNVQVCSWALEAGLGSIANLFAHHVLCGQDLLDLDHDDLLSMGLARLTQRKAVLRATAQFRSDLP